MSDGSAGCGCGYPAYVADGVVERSNAIVAALRETAVAAAAPELREWLGALPRTLVLEVGDERRRVGVVHGDVDSLAGWSWRSRRWSPPTRRCATRSAAAAAPLTPAARVRGWCDEADVGAICSTHTCLPFGQILRNGDEGSRSSTTARPACRICGTTFGLATRVSATSRAPPETRCTVPSRAACASTPCPSATTSAWLRRFNALAGGRRARVVLRADHPRPRVWGRAGGAARRRDPQGRQGGERAVGARERQGELLLTARYVIIFLEAPGLRITSAAASAWAAWAARRRRIAARRRRRCRRP